MIRESLSPGSKHASIFHTGTQGLAFQHRGATNDWSTHDAGGGIRADVDQARTSRLHIHRVVFVRRRHWTTLGQIRISMSGSVYVGLALTSHSPQYASADFTNVYATESSASPSGWISTDVGSPALAGSTSTITDGLALTAGGTDVWGTSDQFRFAYRQMTGDGSIVALVGSSVLPTPIPRPAS